MAQMQVVYYAMYTMMYCILCGDVRCSGRSVSEHCVLTTLIHSVGLYRILSVCLAVMLLYFKIVLVLWSVLPNGGARVFAARAKIRGAAPPTGITHPQCTEKKII